MSSCVTDLDFMESVLREQPGEWVGQMDIITRSFRERGHGLTPHSRASELRTRRGLNVENKVENPHGRRVSFYRLLLSAPPGNGLPGCAPNSIGTGEPSSAVDHGGIAADAHLHDPAGASPVPNLYGVQLAFEDAA